MISSMTAYSRHAHESEWGTITWELRAVNHRYRELGLRLPEQMRHLEPDIRHIVGKSVHRGKLDVVLKFQPNSKATNKLVLNDTIAEQLSSVIESLCDELPKPKVNVAQLLSWPGLLSTEQKENASLDQDTVKSFTEAVGHLCSRRQEEGETIFACLNELLATLNESIQHIDAAHDDIVTRMRERLLTRVEELKTAINQDRFEQEIIYWLNKIDIAEECQRFKAHLTAIGLLIQSQGAVGRKLDFYAQELNREANTIGSKLADIDISAHIVHIKVAIEQLREQAQNIE